MSLPLDMRRRELKLASGELTHAVGGIEAAAALVGKGKSQVHRAGSVNDADTFLTVADVAELERRARTPFVTRLLCKLAGGVFLQLPEAFEDAGALPLHVMELAHEVGDVSAAVVEALADGVVSAREAGAVEQQLDELIDKAVQARALVRAMQEKPAAPLVKAVER